MLLYRVAPEGFYAVAEDGTAGSLEGLRLLHSDPFTTPPEQWELGRGRPRAPAAEDDEPLVPGMLRHMCGEEVGTHVHVVIDKQQQVADGGLRASLPRGGRAGVGLSQDGESEAVGVCVKLCADIGGRSVIDDDDLVARRRQGLCVELPKQAPDLRRALVRRHDDGDAGRRL